MAASRLGLDLIPDKPLNRETKNPLRPELEFLLGFINFSAADLAGPYIRQYENSLTIPELRQLAQALANAGRIDVSLNLVTRYMDREDFELAREDLYLYFPRPFLGLVEKYADWTGVKPQLFYALIRTESYFMPEVVSRSGAVGLCQLMPDTALDMAGRIARRNWPDGNVRDYRTANGIDMKDPETNIHIGGFYLNYLTENMGSQMTAIIAYNGGMGRARRWRAAEPRLPEDLFLETIEFQETRDFGRRVLSAAAVYGYLYYGLNMNEVIADIYR